MAHAVRHECDNARQSAIDEEDTESPGRAGILDLMELIFEVRDAKEGGCCARALGHAIFTEAQTWEELRAKVPDAAALHFEEGPVQPQLVQLHYVKDELIPVEAAWSWPVVIRAVIDRNLDRRSAILKGVFRKPAYVLIAQTSNTSRSK